MNIFEISVRPGMTALMMTPSLKNKIIAVRL